MKSFSCFLILFFAILVSGCSQKINLFPVQGPFSKQMPLPVLEATAYGITGNTGDMTLTMPDGETMKGKWSSAAGQQVTVGSAGLWSKYGYMIGTGYSVSNVPGVNRGEAFMYGSNGTTVEMEFFTGSGTANGYGVAKDSKGNVYKVLF